MNKSRVIFLFSDNSLAFAIVHLPFLDDIIVIYFDFYAFSPYFQGIKGFDVFETEKSAVEFIKKKTKIIEKDTRSGYFLLGLITEPPQTNTSKSSVSLILAKNVEEINLSNGKFIYKINSVEFVSLTPPPFNQNSQRTAYIQNANNLFCSFDVNITSLSNSEENRIFNVFSVSQKPFSQLSINPCPKVINGLVQYRHITENSYLLLICRKNLYKSEQFDSYEYESGINKDGSITNLTEIEIQISKCNKSNIDVSSFCLSLGSMPYSYRIKGKNRDEFDFPQYPFLNTPQFMMGFTKGNSKEVVFLDTSTDELSRILRQTVSFLSGVFRVESHQIDLISNFTDLYHSLPPFQITRRIHFNNYIREESEQNKLIYVASVDGCYGSLAVSFAVLTKVYNSIMNVDNGRKVLADLIWPFYSKFEGVSNSLNDLVKLMNVQCPLQSSNSSDNYLIKKSLSPPPKERCVSFYPTATIVSPKNVDPKILSFSQCKFFYRSPEQPIIISLSNPYMISRIIIMGIHTESTTMNACPSMVTIYGGLYLNQMFPIIENLVLSPIDNTNYPIHNDDPTQIDIPYNPDPFYSRFSKVRFLSFHFSSVFEAFYISNIFVFTDDRKEILVENEKLSIPSSYKDQIMIDEDERILNGDSQSLYLNKKHITYDYFGAVRAFFENEIKMKMSEKNSIMKNYRIQRAFIHYPFLQNHFEIINTTKWNSNIVPFFIASGPQLLESILYHNSISNEQKSFEPIEKLILIKIVFLKSYQIDKIELKCKHPVSLQIINNTDYRIPNQSFEFSPPENEYDVCLRDRVLDLKIVGNPISIQSLNFKSNNPVFTEEQMIENQVNTKVQLKVTNKTQSLRQTEIDFGSKSIIGLKLKDTYGIVPSMFILDGRAFQIKSNKDALFIFPKLVQKIGVVFKEDRTKKISYLCVTPSQQSEIAEILHEQPHSFEIVTI